jgi:hypothetical protein
VSRRDGDRFTIPQVLFPPCIPLDAEIMETYRMEVVRVCSEERAARKAAGEDGPP